MAKLIFHFLLWISMFLQYSHCAREKRGVSDFIIPGINVGDIAMDAVEQLIFGAPEDKDQKIMDRQLEHMQISREILSLTKDILSIVTDGPEMNALITTMQKVAPLISTIDQSFIQYEEYKFYKRNSSDYQVLEFAKASYNRYIGPMKNLIELHAISIPDAPSRTSKSDYSLVALMARLMKGYQKLCDKYKSQQQILQLILEAITVAEFKVYVIMQFSLRVVAEVEKIDFDKEKERLTNGMKYRLEKLTTAFQTFMKGTSRDVWRCDPAKYIPDETYFNMTVFQLYVTREINLRGSGGSCYKKCSDFKYATREERCHKFAPHYDNQNPHPQYSACHSVRRCEGFIYDCTETFNTHNELWTCPAPRNSSRRYMTFIHGYKSTIMNSARLSVYGTKAALCTQQMTYDYRQYSSSLRDCDICLCTCDDSETSYGDYKVNLRPVTADKDYVITGLRWLKKDHTMHIQIEQGKISARGSIDPDTLHWKDIPEPRDTNDFANITYHGLKSILLHDLELAKDKVLVGIKLEIVQNYYRKLITFRLLGVPYKWTTGKLVYPNDKNTPFYDDPDKSLTYRNLWEENVKPYFYSNEEADVGIGKLPTDTSRPSVLFDPTKKWLQLKTSHFGSDIGQNTVPFFDMQDNLQSPAFPLSGAGIYYKKIDDYAGFLGIKLLTFDHSHLLVERKSV